MIIGSTYIKTTGPDPIFLLGVRFSRAEQTVFVIPVVAWQLLGLENLWMGIGIPGGETEADRVTVRVQDLDYPVWVRVDPWGGSDQGSFIQQVPATPGTTLTEYSFELPVTSPTAPPSGGISPGSPALLNGLSFDTTQVTPGGKVAVTASVTVTATFQGQMNTWLWVGGQPPEGPYPPAPGTS